MSQNESNSQVLQNSTRRRLKPKKESAPSISFSTMEWCEDGVDSLLREPRTKGSCSFMDFRAKGQKEGEG